MNAITAIFTSNNIPAEITDLLKNKDGSQPKTEQALSAKLKKFGMKVEEGALYYEGMVYPFSVKEWLTTTVGRDLPTESVVIATGHPLEAEAALKNKAKTMVVEADNTPNHGQPGSDNGAENPKKEGAMSTIETTATETPVDPARRANAIEALTVAYRTRLERELADKDATLTRLEAEVKRLADGQAEALKGATPRAVKGYENNLAGFCKSVEDTKLQVAKLKEKLAPEAVEAKVSEISEGLTDEALEAKVAAFEKSLVLPNPKELGGKSRRSEQPRPVPTRTLKRANPVVKAKVKAEVKAAEAKAEVREVPEVPEVIVTLGGDIAQTRLEIENLLKEKDLHNQNRRWAEKAGRRLSALEKAVVRYSQDGTGYYMETQLQGMSPEEVVDFCGDLYRKEFEMGLRRCHDQVAEVKALRQEAAKAEPKAEKKGFSVEGLRASITKNRDKLVSMILRAEKLGGEKKLVKAFRDLAAQCNPEKVDPAILSNRKAQELAKAKLEEMNSNIQQGEAMLDRAEKGELIEGSIGEVVEAVEESPWSLWVDSHKDKMGESYILAVACRLNSKVNRAKPITLADLEQFQERLTKVTPEAIAKAEGDHIKGIQAEEAQKARKAAKAEEKAQAKAEKEAKVEEMMAAIKADAEKGLNALIEQAGLILACKAAIESMEEGDEKVAKLVELECRQKDLVGSDARKATLLNLGLSGEYTGVILGLFTTPQLLGMLVNEDITSALATFLKVEDVVPGAFRFHTASVPRHIGTAVNFVRRKVGEFFGWVKGFFVKKEEPKLSLLKEGEHVSMETPKEEKPGVVRKAVRLVRSYASAAWSTTVEVVTNPKETAMAIGRGIKVAAEKAWEVITHPVESVKAAARWVADKAVSLWSRVTGFFGGLFGKKATETAAVGS